MSHIQKAREAYAQYKGIAVPTTKMSQEESWLDYIFADIFNCYQLRNACNVSYEQDKLSNTIPIWEVPVPSDMSKQEIENILTRNEINYHFEYERKGFKVLFLVINMNPKEYTKINYENHFSNFFSAFYRSSSKWILSNS